MGLSSKQVSEIGDLDIPNANNNSPGARGPLIKCPRCDSTNTKFCYYNNYSKLQPRHFCRACKRHWTHGGNLRNVPVGGARRNNSSNRKRPKTTTSTYHNNNNSSNSNSNNNNEALPFVNSGDQQKRMSDDAAATLMFPDIFRHDLCSDRYYSSSASCSSSVYNLEVQAAAAAAEDRSYWNTCWDGMLMDDQFDGTESLLL